MEKKNSRIEIRLTESMLSKLKTLCKKKAGQ